MPLILSRRLLLAAFASLAVGRTARAEEPAYYSGGFLQSVSDFTQSFGEFWNTVQDALHDDNGPAAVAAENQLGRSGASLVVLSYLNAWHEDWVRGQTGPVSLLNSRAIDQALVLADWTIGYAMADAEHLADHIPNLLKMMPTLSMISKLWRVAL